MCIRDRNVHALLITEYPFIGAIAEACLHTISYKEAAMLSVLQVLMDNLLTLGKHIEPIHLASIYRILIDAAAANLVSRSASYSNHLFMIMGGTSESSVTPLSLIHISEPTRLLSISYAVFCLKKKNK
eukprot:TRINITY_DN64872_c0_g1_i1.p1 TRINITY_DN64872_c0_g1~~TRINITY_DN64872_c0_g1_i1.p1  ORF type:complete len:128 (-),score=21.75 TRINITY_DN64872_c0_g1_i1:135-518(-)